MDEIKKLLSDIKSAHEEYKKTNDERLAEVEKGRENAVTVDKLDKIDKHMDKLQDRLADAEKALARRTSPPAGGDDMDKKARDFAVFAAKNRGLSENHPDFQDFDGKSLAEYRKSFKEYMRKGDGMGPAHEKALSVGIDPDGGYLVDPDTSGRIVKKVFETSPMRSIASQQTIGTDALEGVYDLDEADAGWVGETQARPETDTPKIQKWRIPTHELYANPYATQKLLDDSMVNLEQWLADKVADKFSRKENEAFVNGDGVGKPRGFLTYPAGTDIPGTIEQILSGVDGGFASDGTGGDVLIDTVYSLKQAYRSGANWTMPRAVTKEVRKLKDADGVYLWQPGIAAGQPSTLLGYSIVEFEDMPELATGSLSIGFGNFQEAYQIVDRNGVRVLRDPYSAKPYIQFYTVKRTGGDVLNFEAVKLIKFSAS